MAVVPHVQKPLLGAVGEHGQHAPRRPQVKGYVDRFALQQVEGEADPGVLGVGDVEDAAGNEGVAGLGAGVGGVDVGADGEGLLVQLGHHDALIDAGREDQPHAVLVRRHFEIGLGVDQQVGEVVVQGMVDGQGVQPLGQQVESVKVIYMLVKWGSVSQCFSNGVTWTLRGTLEDCKGYLANISKNRKEKNYSEKNMLSVTS